MKCVSWSPRASGPHASFEHSVAIKLVPSISPVDGNNPSFTIARVNRSSAVLQDYEVIAASNQTGIDTTWSREYDYAQAYHEAQFSPVDGERTDCGSSKTIATQRRKPARQYIRNYFVGDRSL